MHMYVLVPVEGEEEGWLVCLLDVGWLVDVFLGFLFTLPGLFLLAVVLELDRAIEVCLMGEGRLLFLLNMPCLGLLETIIDRFRCLMGPEVGLDEVLPLVLLVFNRVRCARSFSF